MFRVGLTGGIASGKSRAAEIFASLGVTVIDSEQGRVALSLSSAAVAALATQSQWELLVVQPSGVKRLWLRGVLTRS